MQRRNLCNETIQATCSNCPITQLKHWLSRLNGKARAVPYSDWFHFQSAHASDPTLLCSRHVFRKRYYLQCGQVAERRELIRLNCCQPVVQQAPEEGGRERNKPRSCMHQCKLLLQYQNRCTSRHRTNRIPIKSTSYPMKLFQTGHELSVLNIP